MGIEEILGEKREEIRRIAAKHGVTSIRVFGSVARGEAGPHSDVDFLTFRDVIVHDYLGLNLDRIWDIATIHVPALKPHMGRIATDLRV